MENAYISLGYPASEESKGGNSMTAKDRLHIEAIKFKDGRVMVIEYVRVSSIPTFEKRGRRFRPA